MMSEKSVADPGRVPDEEVAALVRRVRDTRVVADPWSGESAKGFGDDALRSALDRWVNGYDWREHEARIRSLPWELAGAGDRSLRVIHQRSSNPGAPVVVLLHGWPDSVLRFERLLPLLSDAHVVVPALPGFPFALRTDRPASVNDMAASVRAALSSLGYDRYVLSGGDVGGDVAEILAGMHPDRVAALHLTNISPRHAQAVDPDRLDPAARAYLGVAAAWFRGSGGYIAEQSTRPRTLLASLGDSPAGLAAWILEKVTEWSEDVTASFSTDDMLTWVSAYWLTASIGTSFSTYAEPASMPERTNVPTVVSAFPADIKPAPREYVEVFADVREFVEHSAGGHFAAWEQPEAYAADLNLAVSLGRPQDVG